MGRSSIALIVVTFLVGACGGPRANLREDNRRLQSKVDQLRAQARRDRSKMRDLENQLFLLEDKLDTAQTEGGRVGAPSLPVEVLEPEATAAEPESDDGWKVVGTADDGTEIVYAGDAAKDRVVRPSLESYGNEGSEQPAAPTSRRPLTPLPQPRPDDRIPVTSEVPTVAQQLRQARRSRRESPNRTGARSLYQRHYAALRAGDHSAAMAGFRDFVEAYPEHDYADNAQYWLGEAYYDQKQYKRAMREFRRVIKRYPRGNKVPDALLKIGYCYASLGETMKARDVFGQLVRVYPSSNPAKLAKQKLSELSGSQE